MNSAVQIPQRQIALAELPIDERRGWYGMWCVIATEFMLFVCMFGAYYYLGANKYRWAEEMPPKLRYPLIMLAILLASSFVLKWGEDHVKRGNFALAKWALWATVLMGLVFLLIQAVEYTSHWKELTPYSDSYGSIFYANRLAACGACDCRFVNACLCRHSSALRRHRRIAPPRLSNRGALLALRRRSVGLYRAAVVHRPELPGVALWPRIRRCKVLKSRRDGCGSGL